MPPIARPDWQPPPKIPDHILYEQIFELQNRAKWAEADKLIRQLDDKILLGHVYRLRYMHPTDYRAKWEELRNWLTLYADHPGAWQVYNLARKRKPRHANMPKEPPERIWHQVSAHRPSRLFRKQATRRIKREVERLIYRERPTQAIRYISRHSIDIQLTAAETDYLRANIARSYYIEGKPGRALEVARQATRSRDIITIADWHAGLAAWRLGRFDDALSHFVALAKNPAASRRYQSAGAFWAARIYRKRHQDIRMREMLDWAIQTGKTNFYGLLAAYQLNDGIHIIWQADENENNDIEPLDHYPAINRAQKLLAAKQQELAELELLYAAERLPGNEIPALATLAYNKQLPAVELALTHRLDLARSRQGFEISRGQFPLPGYAPITGYTLDRAVLFGLIRQESRFKPYAKSQAGARGLMQVMPATAAFVTGDRKLYYRSGRHQLYRISLNLNIGQSYLQGLLADDQINNNLMIALAAYNAGPGTVKRWIREMGQPDDPLLFMESLSAPETRLYIQKVMRNIWLYRHRMEQPAITLDNLAKSRWPIYIAQDKSGQFN